MRCLLVRDAGGSVCSALAVNDRGTVLGAGRCDVNDSRSGRGPDGCGRSLESARVASNQALSGITCAELIIVNGPSNTEDYSNVLEQVSYVHVTEQDAAFALADQSAGVVVLSGRIIRPREDERRQSCSSGRPGA